MDSLFQNYSAFSQIAKLADENRYRSIVSIVETIQKKTNKPHIEFTTQTGYPTFIDATTDELEVVVGARVSNGVLEFNTCLYLEESNDNWFQTLAYGTFHYDDFVYLLSQMVENLEK